jgi:hypothetical protein
MEHKANFLILIARRACESPANALAIDSCPARQRVCRYQIQSVCQHQTRVYNSRIGIRMYFTMRNCSDELQEAPNQVQRKALAKIRLVCPDPDAVNVLSSLNIPTTVNRKPMKHSSVQIFAVYRVSYSNRYRQGCSLIDWLAPVTFPDHSFLLTSRPPCQDVKHTKEWTGTSLRVRQSISENLACTCFNNSPCTCN